MLNIDSEYDRCVQTLDTTGILVPLTQSKNAGVMGIDGEEYPLPTLEKVKETFTRNKELVERKTKQGFTQLQLTPMAMPILHLVDRVGTVITEHAEKGKIIQTKREPTDVDNPVGIHKDEPVWIWDNVQKAFDTPELVYFPRDFSEQDDHGLTKVEVMQDPHYCAVPGWSVGLIEPIPMMPRRGQGLVKGRRKQLEAKSTPNEYLETLRGPTYKGETGWTPEDFLIHFVTHLEMTDQVSHDRADGNALWMLGSYMPNSIPDALIVPTGNWARDAGQRMYIGGHRTNNRIRFLVARSIVRLVG